MNTILKDKTAAKEKRRGKKKKRVKTDNNATQKLSLKTFIDARTP